MKENNLKKGITIAGNITADYNQYINVYPAEGTLVAINDTSKTFGGAVSNTAINLSLIDNKTHIVVAGNIGDDADGKEIIKLYKSYGLDTSGIKQIENYKTATVYSFINTTNHMRTFFADLRVSNIYGKEKIECTTSHFHLGYILLLPYLDQITENGRTRLSYLLEELQQKGIKTSADLVSEESDRYADIVVPSLSYLNYLIINEIEASRIVNINIYKDNQINIEKVKEVAYKLKSLGVKDLVVIHSSSFGLIYDGHNYTILPSLTLPSNFIKSSVGAGDGFCAGILYGILNDYEHLEMLKLASSVAAGVLNSDTSQSKIKGLKNFLELEKKYRQFWFIVKIKEFNI